MCNGIEIAMKPRIHLLSALIAVLLALGIGLFSGCGGGFKGDSPNAVEIEEPIFGGDSL
jgi:hypothetical protein